VLPLKSARRPNRAFASELSEKLGYPTSETIQGRRLLKAFIRPSPSQRAEVIDLVEQLATDPGPVPAASTGISRCDERIVSLNSFVPSRASLARHSIAWLHEEASSRVHSRASIHAASRARFDDPAFDKIFEARLLLRRTVAATRQRQKPRLDKGLGSRGLA
jgi:hypothetical protein